MFSTETPFIFINPVKVKLSHTIRPERKLSKVVFPQPKTKLVLI